MQELIEAILTDEERVARERALNRATRDEIEMRTLLRAFAEAWNRRVTL